MLLTDSRHQVMYNVSCVSPCAKVTCNWYFIILQQSKGENQALDLRLLPPLLWSYTFFIVCNYDFYYLFLNLGTLLCCTDLETSLQCKVNTKSHNLRRSRKRDGTILFWKWGGWYYSRNKIKSFSDPACEVPSDPYCNSNIKHETKIFKLNFYMVGKLWQHRSVKNFLLVIFRCKWKK